MADPTQDQIHAMVRTIEAHNAAWRRWFTAIDVLPYPVGYEELIADPTGVTRGILDVLGLALSATCTVAPAHSRQADEINEDWIRRYRAALMTGRDPHAAR